MNPIIQIILSAIIGGLIGGIYGLVFSRIAIKRNNKILSDAKMLYRQSHDQCGAYSVDSLSIRDIQNP